MAAAAAAGPRRRELAVAANRGRLDAISLFYTGNELWRLLHPRPPAPNSPALYTDIPDSVSVTGDSSALATFKDDLGPDKTQVQMVDSAVRVSGIHPVDLQWVLSLVERGGLGAAWESELAAAAKATKARCLSCVDRHLTPTTQFTDETCRIVKWWCAQCSGFRCCLEDR